MKISLDWFSQHKPDWKSFFSSLLPLLWLLLPLSILIISSRYQATQTLENTLKNPIEKTEKVPDQGDGVLFLHIVYPQKLDLGGATTAKAPISMWLSYASPYPSPTLTPSKRVETSTPTPNVSITISAITPTPTPTATPYVLSLFVSPNGLTFTDKDGQPISAQIALTPSRFGVTPAVLFAQVNSNSEDQSIIILPSIRNENGTQSLSPIFIEPETRTSAWWRLFYSLLLTPTLIGALLLAIAQSAIQQWGKADDERRSKAKIAAEKEKEKKGQIANLTSLLKDKPAEGARQYLEAQKTISVSDAFFLDAIWSGVSGELKNLVEMECVYKNPEFKQVVEKLGKEKVEQAIKYALQHRLDEDWESRAAAILQAIIPLQLSWGDKLDGQLLRLAEQRTREASIKMWPNISYWRLTPPDHKASFDEKMKFYEKTPHPFGAPHAEENIWLFDGRFDGRYSDQIELTDIERMDSVVVSGTPGWGKTTTALWLMDDALRSKNAFPVYIPTTLDISLTEIAPILARTLLRYLAINPSSFLKRGMAGRASIAHLFAEYLGKESNLTLLLRKAGLPQTGAGLEVEQEIQRLTKDYPAKSQQTEPEILTILSENYPDGFNTTWLLIDIQGDIDNEKSLNHFFEMIIKLNRIGLKTKVFLSNKTDNPANLEAAPIPVRILKWSADDLRGLIKVRLQRLGEESLSALCQPAVRWRSRLTPEERFVAASSGMPGILVQKGNQLLKRISRNKDLLSERDLDEILGPVQKKSTPRRKDSEMKQ